MVLHTTKLHQQLARIHHNSDRTPDLQNLVGLGALVDLSIASAQKEQDESEFCWTAQC
jgi:hypothetical protein